MDVSQGMELVPAVMGLLKGGDRCHVGLEGVAALLGVPSRRWSATAAPQQAGTWTGASTAR
ncbi:conserved hypothetical protein [Streptomyces sviceus ATCC 29083]|uniref:Uncharacterized protein n=1 Tax=Streptomyces sviceus (strain ATCC 29083 / DSM 924 / JCM 4929 / NBRC 13980 / NCIMB 11184 / NRRL 5439 / UC 5370) TaxID=463191 RepID=B5I3F1_STRX2|nr:conserved hypothetical protein [Streptomyces sviceus ATCC 29083]